MKKQQPTDQHLSGDHSSDQVLIDREAKATASSPLPWLLNCIVKRQSETPVSSVPPIDTSAK